MKKEKPPLRLPLAILKNLPLLRRNNPPLHRPGQRLRLVAKSLAKVDSKRRGRLLEKEALDSRLVLKNFGLSKRR